MRRLIWAFAVRICPNKRYRMAWLTLRLCIYDYAKHCCNETPGNCPGWSKQSMHAYLRTFQQIFPYISDYPADPCKTGDNGALYPHPDDCGKFIQCVNGQVQEMTCAPKLVFHPGNKQCIFPPNPDLVCPDIQPCKEKDDGYFPHPFDCSRFIQCQFKKEVVLTCQNGLVWNSVVNSCVHKTPDYVCPVESASGR